MATKTPMTPEELRAKSKLKALSVGQRVWMLEQGETPRYACPSNSHPAVAYEIIVHGNDLYDITCSCPSGCYRGSCVHIGAVLLLREAEFEYVEAVDEASAVAIPTQLDKELDAIGL